ncbi:MAG: hypothetical protein HY784_10810, partial [Chloroflexi bacterium]|nr:hypothetical protein [Chloroflexota bacterium]
SRPNGTATAPPAVGWACLRQGRFELAQALFDAAVRAGPGRADGYVGRAIAELSRGDIQAARYDLAFAGALSRTGQVWVWYQFTQGDLAEAEGNRAEAIRWYRGAAEGVLNQTAFGPGTYGRTSYTWLVWRREGPLQDLLPQMSMIAVTDPVAAKLLTLAQWYGAAGEHAAAREVEQAVYQADPDYSARTGSPEP